ncbi:hypothetical protein ACEN8K_44910, partial [Variovorax sp. CT11-76]
PPPPPGRGPPPPPPPPPPDVVQALNAALRKALADENVKRRLISVGSPGQASSSEEWLATLKKEDAGARLLAKSGKLKVD